MKIRYILFGLILLLSAGNLFSQTNQSGKLIIPFLDSESQSNIIVSVSDDFGSGQPCPDEYTNTLSNTNLFTPEQQIAIKEVFVKYKNVTTNSWPPGTMLAALYKTNLVIKAMDRMVEAENWIARFQYTNCDAHEEIRFGKGGILAKYRDKSNDGYNVYIGRTGGGSVFRFMEVKRDLINGRLSTFDDNRPQGTTWDYRLADFSNAHLTEYRRYTNSMVIGKFLMWNLQNNNVILEADFKEPYDFEKHRTDLRMLQQHP